MNIAFIVHTFPSITQTFIFKQIKGLLKEGHRVDIYARRWDRMPPAHEDARAAQLLARTRYFRLLTHLNGQQGLDGVIKCLRRYPREILRSFDFRTYGWRASFTLFPYTVISLAGPRNYDIVHAHFGPNGIKAQALREIGALKGKLIVSFHGYDVSRYTTRFGKGVYQRLFEKGDMFLPVCPSIKEQLAALGCEKDKLTVLASGVDGGKFSFLPLPFTPGEKLKLVSVGRLVEKKGIADALIAFSKLINIYPEASYTIVGDGPLRKALQKQARRLRINDFVKFVGVKNQAEIISLLHESHIFLALSMTARNGDAEGLPVSILEAMSAGVPVISTQHSGIPELIEDDVSGFLVPEGDSEAVVKKISSLMRNPERLGGVAKAAREKVETHHNIKQLNERLIDIYRQVLEKEDVGG